MRLLALALAAAALLAGCASSTPESPPPPGTAAPTWSFATLEGDTVTSTDPSRNASVLFFMATWCGTCRTKAPTLADAHETYADRGVAFYSVDFDPSETQDDLRAWKERYDQPWPHGLDPQRDVQRALGVRSQSTVVVLDAEGHVVQRFDFGQVDARALGAAIEAALARDGPADRSNASSNSA